MKGDSFVTPSPNGTDPTKVPRNKTRTAPRHAPPDQAVVVELDDPVGGSSPSARAERNKEAEPAATRFKSSLTASVESLIDPLDVSSPDNTQRIRATSVSDRHACPQMPEPTVDRAALPLAADLETRPHRRSPPAGHITEEDWDRPTSGTWWTNEELMFQELRHVSPARRPRSRQPVAAGRAHRRPRTRAGSPAIDDARPGRQSAPIIIAGRPTCARWTKVIGAPTSAVMVLAISARRWS